MKMVTGASGFIGKNLVKKIGDCICIPHEEIISTDWSKATHVYFLSTYGNMASHDDTAKTLKANIIDLCFVLESVDWFKIESFVFLSTSSVKLKRQTMYSRTKKAAEEILLSYREKYDAPITIIRPLSVTGAGELSEHLIPKLINSCFTQEEMPFVSEPTHDFIDVDDLTDGILNLSSNQARGIFELGTGVATSNIDVLRLVKKITGINPKVKLVKQMRDYDNERWVCENFKARGWGWLHKKTLELSIQEMVHDFEQNLPN
jgi:nucleoside-diphosphate-sugar epimerase